MTNLGVIENRIGLIKKYLKILEDFKSKSKTDLEKDVILKGALERYLYLVTQGVLDLAEAIIAFKGFRKPPFYSANFEVLKEEKFLAASLAEALSKMAGFRNVLAHDYAKIDFGIVYGILQNGLGDIQMFIDQVQSKLAK